MKKSSPLPPSPPSIVVTKSPSKSGKYSQNSGLIGLNRIDDFCEALQSYSSNRCLGFLDDKSWQHKVYLSPGFNDATQMPNVATLQEVIYANKFRMSVLEKCKLAFTLASAVLQLYDTPWLPANWDSKDIFMANTTTGNRPMSQFYVSRSFNTSPTKQSIAKRRRLVKNEIVFALGVTLLELSYGQSLFTLKTSDDLNEDGSIDSMTEVSIAMRLADRIHEREMDNYAKAVLRCVRCNFDTFYCDFEDREFREKFHDGVLVPLRSDYEYAIGGRPS
jgi:hypothetical protein